MQEDDSDDQIVPVHLRNPEEASCYASHTSSCFFSTYLLGAHIPLATLLDWPSARMRRKLLLEQSIRPWAQRPEELPDILVGPTKTVYSGPRGRRLQKAAVCKCLHVTYRATDSVQRRTAVKKIWQQRARCCFFPRGRCTNGCAHASRLAVVIQVSSACVVTGTTASSVITSTRSESERTRKRSKRRLCAHCTPSRLCLMACRSPNPAMTYLWLDGDIGTDAFSSPSVQ